MSNWQFSQGVIDKARTFIEQGRVEEIPVPVLTTEPLQHLRVFKVTGSKAYRVRTDAHDGHASWITCTCPHGQFVGSMVAKCSHAVAVLIWVKESEQS